MMPTQRFYFLHPNILSLMNTCLFSLLMFGTSAQALPTYDSPWPQVTLNTTASWLRDSKDERLIWVLPPATGNIKVSGPLPEVDARRCQDLQSDLDNLSLSSEEFSRFVADLREQQPRLQEALARSRKDHQALSAWRTSTNVHRTMSRYWQNAKEWAMEQDYVNQKLERCTVLSYCQIFEHQSIIANTLRVDAEVSLAEVRDEYPEAHQQLIQLANAYERSHGRVTALRRQIDSYRQHLTELEAILSRSYRNQAMVSGGNVTVVYRLEHKEILVQLRKAHPKLRFKMVPLKQLRLFARMVPTVVDDYYLASLPAFLRFRAKDLPTTTVGGWQLDQPPLKALPDTITGEFTLSLHGACGLTQTEFFRAKGLAITREDSIPRYAAVLQYHYPVAVPERLRVRFNLAELYKALRALWKKSAIITPAHIAELMARDSLRSLFAITQLDPHLRFAVPAQLRDSLITRIMEQLLTTMATPTLTLGGQLEPWSEQSWRRYRLTEAGCPSIACRTGGWLRLPADTERQALNRLKALSDQVIEVGPNKPLWLPGLSQFASFAVGGQ